MEHHRLSLASMQPGVPYMRHPYRIPVTPSTTPQEDAVAVAVMHDQDYVSSNVNSNVFEVGEVVAFRGNDGLPFNLLRVTHLCAVLAPDPESAGTFLLKLQEMVTVFAIP